MWAEGWLPLSTATVVTLTAIDFESEVRLKVSLACERGFGFRDHSGFIFRVGT